MSHIVRGVPVAGIPEYLAAYVCREILLGSVEFSLRFWRPFRPEMAGTGSNVSDFCIRVHLGFGIGPKSATIPIYAAESAPASIRGNISHIRDQLGALLKKRHTGALVMMWQMWTAFGIALGYVAAVVLRTVRDGDSDFCNGADQEVMLSLRCVSSIPRKI